MAVLLTISKTVTGADAADALAGGSTGLDLGQVVNGQYSPITSQAANTGKQELWFFHNAVVDPITDVKFYVAQYTGTYGGAASAAADFATLGAYGAADTGATKNNTDGLSRGLAIDMDWQVNDANQFDYSREATGQKRIFGKTYTTPTGLSALLAFALHADACSYWNGASEIDATTPVTSKIGKSSDTVLGNRAHIQKRFYLHTASVDGGYVQYDFVTIYSFTA